MVKHAFFGLICLAAYAPAVAMAEERGRLVIAGGAVDADNAAIWTAFIEGLPENGSVYIIPSASSSPASSAAFATDALVQHGLAADRIKTAPLAIRDDRDTKDVDESKWKKNAQDPALSATLRDAAGFWFTGGDQLRTTDLLMPKGDSPALTAVRAAHQNGASIGGTSAGAAIMSELMIFGGNSFTAFAHPPAREEGDGLLVTQGIGFFPYGVVDQHFGERGRLGRLIRALGVVPDPNARLGFGVDEGTALIVDFPAHLGVAGDGYVTVVDASDAKLRDHPGGYRATELTLHLLAPDDAFDLSTGVITPADYRKSTVDDPYNDRSPLNGGGIAFGPQILADIIGDELIDNKAARQVIRDSFTDNGKGLRYRFTQSSQSAGFWGRNDEGRAQYTVIGIEMDILPIRVDIEEITD